MLAKAPVLDPRVIVGPGVGLDYAVIEAGGSLLVYKSDPITFTAEELSWYAVQINANDIATTGATPRWFLVTLLLPEERTTAVLVEQIFNQLYEAWGEIGVSLVGGHTEITVGLERPIIVGTMIGEVEPDHLDTPRGAAPGDRILLTKGAPIEATAILAREFPDRLRPVLSEAEIKQAGAFLTSPSISVLRDAQIAMQAGSVTAMHDPTEGGLVGIGVGRQPGLAKVIAAFDGQRFGNGQRLGEGAAGLAANAGAVSGRLDDAAVGGGVHDHLKGRIIAAGKVGNVVAVKFNQTVSELGVNLEGVGKGDIEAVGHNGRQRISSILSRLPV